jgi:hypothetical protein
MVYLWLIVISVEKKQHEKLFLVELYFRPQ